MTTICLVGAGSAVFTRQLLRDLLSYDDLGPLTLVLHDIDERRLQLAGDLARLTVAHHGRLFSEPVTAPRSPRARTRSAGYPVTEATSLKERPCAYSSTISSRS